MPRLCRFYPGICLTTEGRARKNLSQGRSLDLTPLNYNLVGTHKEHGLLAKNCRQRKKLCSNSCSPLTAQGQKIKSSEKKKTLNSLLRRAEFCMRVAEVILNNNQCKIIENLQSLLLCNKNFFCLYCD
jgi:hypothetical protein